MARSLSFEWNGGFLRVRVDEGLVIEAENTTITLMQREIDIKGLFMSYEEHLTDRRGERKVVYVNFAFPVKGFSKERVRELVLSNGDFSVGPFGISYTKLGDIGRYLTIYTPPGFLYEVAVLTKEKLALFTIGRRQVYLLEEGRDVKKLLLL